MRIINDVKPKGKIQRTNAQLYSQDLTYNEANLTYNEAGYAYGGSYDHDIIPLISLSREVKARVSIQKTNAGLNDDGITYNENGISYNEVGYEYEGIYDYDVVPMVKLASIVKPRIVFSGDIYTNVMPPTENFSIGPGFFMFITQ